MARKKHPRRKRNIGTASKVVIGLVVAVGAVYGLAWASYRFKGKPKMDAAPDGSAALPDGNQADGTEGGFKWQVRYDSSMPETPYRWKVTSPSGTVTKSATTTYANARSAIAFAIKLG